MTKHFQNLTMQIGVVQGIPVVQNTGFKILKQNPLIFL